MYNLKWFLHLQRRVGHQCYTDKRDEAQETPLNRRVSLFHQFWVLGVVNLLRLMLWCGNQFSSAHCIFAQIIDIVIVLLLFCLLLVNFEHNGLEVLGELFQFLWWKVVGQGAVIGGDVAVASVLAAGLTEDGADKGGGAVGLALLTLAVYRFDGAGALNDHSVVD